MVGARSLTSASMQTNCGDLLIELHNIWAEIGESEAHKECLLFEIEKECLQVYQKKVDEASKTRAWLYHSVAAKEAELAALMASLGEHTICSQTEKRLASLKDQLATLTPLLEEMRVKKEERAKQIADLRSEIQKISAEINESTHHNGAVIKGFDGEEQDLSVRRLNEYQAQLQCLQKDKSDRIHKVLEYVNEVHSLCGVLGLDFAKTVDAVHPSLHKTGSEESTNISNNTLEGLAQAIQKLKEEKITRLRKLQETVESLLELWTLMDSTEEERRRFVKITYICQSTEQDVTYSGVLSQEIIKQTEAEVERLKTLKASRIKELLSKRRIEVEEVCRRAHIKPDTSTAPEKTNALIDSGLMDPSELLANIEEQITKAKQESLCRKDILDRINKWFASCEEENWLEDYNQDANRYSAGKGAHLNLKRAEKARIIVSKIPAIVDNLISKTFAWEDEKNMPFLYDGVRLVSILEDYKITRQQREEEKRSFREQKKLHSLLLTEKDSIYRSNQSPKRFNSFNTKINGYYANGNTTPSPRRSSVGCVTPELLTPRSYAGQQNGYFKGMRRLSTTPLNFVALPKEYSSSSLASVSGSEPESLMPF